MTNQDQQDISESHDNDKSGGKKKVNKFNKHDDKLAKEQDGKFEEGQTLTMVRVRFPGNAKSQPFLLGKRKFTYGQKVIAMSDRGMTVGYINSFPYEVTFDKSMLPIRSISKVATQEDIDEQKSYLKKENEAEIICLRLIEKYNLNMNLTHVEFIQFGKKAVFYFTAPERVDFRNLVKDLVSEIKMRIELRQISVRDRAAALGATGACGLQTCCSYFLTNYGNVSIKMAKNQNLALIPSKINGVCGQVKCCIKYEDDVYTNKREFLPGEGSYIRTKNGDIGKVLKLHILLEQFEMLTDRGYIRRYYKNQFDKKRCRPPKEWSFPTEFRSITKETSTIIGIEELEEELRLRKQAFLKSLNNDSDSDDIEEDAHELFDDEEESNNSDDEDIEKIPLDSTEDESDNIPKQKIEKKRHNNNRPKRRPTNRNEKGDKDSDDRPRNRRPQDKNAQSEDGQNKSQNKNRNRNRNRNKSKSGNFRKPSGDKPKNTETKPNQ
ncbi:MULTISPECIES: stage 0 sporulation family protein [unclassified Halobacteriovorax]|uniref:PSP1 domain-containing protein n=1 Tax=unclassified Halobacteriovorax TaxID=2639665 RepID=UPI00399A5D20